MNGDSSIQENVLRMRERIETAARRTQRSVAEIELIAVSKTHPVGAIREAFAAGVRHFGENRVQEFEGKLPALQDLPGTWHLVGHLQSNKAIRAAKAFHYIDAVDDWPLAQRLDRAQAEKNSRERLRVLVEVHLGGEESKNGVNEAGLPQLAEKLMNCEHLHFAGLMCIPPFCENPDDARPFFAQLRKYKEALESRLGILLPVLSMGMSHDFEAAIGEGSTEIRVGTAIFGTRQKPT